MAGLTGLLPKNTYGDLIQLNNAGAGVTAAPRQMQDGLGNNTGLNVGSAWCQFPAGRARLTSSPTNITNAPANLADLTLTLLAGRKYFGQLVLFAQNSTVGEGLQFDLAGGSATMTSVQFGLVPGPGITAGVVQSTALATALTATSVTTTAVAYIIPIGLVVNLAGTIIPRFAENSAHVSGTATVFVNSYLWLDDSPN